jgi:hypothetical protein
MDLQITHLNGHPSQQVLKVTIFAIDMFLRSTAISKRAIATHSDDRMESTFASQLSPNLVAALHFVEERRQPFKSIVTDCRHASAVRIGD